MPLPTSLVRPLGKAEFILLSCFLVALPLVEAPKNIFLAAYLLTWLFCSLRQRNFGSLARGWDAIFAALLVVPTCSVVFSDPYPHVWKELGDIVGYVLLGWSLARSRVDLRQILWLLGCAVAATLVGIVHGYAVLALDPKRIWLQLNSVGHVNHSALYGAGIGIMAAALSLYSRALPARQRWLIAAAALACFGGVVAFASRGAFVAYLAGVMLVAIPCVLSWRRRFVVVAAAGISLALIVAVVAQGLVFLAAQEKNGSSLVQKTMDNVRDNDVTSARAQLARAAIEFWRHRPLLGMGAANFAAAPPQTVQTWVEARGEVFEPKRYLFANHAHNIYFNTLAERGALGELVLITLGLGWAWALWCKRPFVVSFDVVPLAWASGAAGWAVVFVGGLFNTTLHHEHGMLCMVGLALLLGSASVGRSTELA